MEINFDFHTSAEIYFGKGRISQLPSLCERFGKRIFLFKGKKSLEENGVLERILNKFKEKNFVYKIWTVSSEPEVETVDEAYLEAKEFNCDLIVAIGGGSVIDTAKAVSGLYTNEGSIIDYLEGVGKGKKIEREALPFIAIPTTAGTGTEVTKNAVISSKKDKFKKSIRHNYLIPRIALISPELSYSQPPWVTSSCGMDALTQLIEPYVSIKSNPLIDSICIKGIGLVANSLLPAYLDGNNELSRNNMSLASLFSGIALANAGLGAVHGIAGALGGLFEIPHGVACAAILPYVFQENIKGIIKREGLAEGIKKYVIISQILTNSNEKNEIKSIEKGVDYLKELKRKLKIPSLSNFGIKKDDVPSIIKMCGGTSMKTNPVLLSDDEIENILISGL